MLITQEPASQSGGQDSELEVGSRGLDWLTAWSSHLILNHLPSLGNARVLFLPPFFFPVCLFVVETGSHCVTLAAWNSPWDQANFRFREIHPPLASASHVLELKVCAIVFFFCVCFAFRFVFIHVSV